MTPPQAAETDNKYKGDNKYVASANQTRGHSHVRDRIEAENNRGHSNIRDIGYREPLLIEQEKSAQKPPIAQVQTTQNVNNQF